MNIQSVISGAIAQKTELDPVNLVDDVISLFNDDPGEILGILIKHKTDPELCLKLLNNIVDGAIDDAILEAEKCRG
tara:strand:- start:539 stop:766 length:228 start_codon:yes stop_codon:yes gene_type:complete